MTIQHKKKSFPLKPLLSPILASPARTQMKACCDRWPPSGGALKKMVKVKKFLFEVYFHLMTVNFAWQGSFNNPHCLWANSIFKIHITYCTPTSKFFINLYAHRTHYLLVILTTFKLIQYSKVHIAHTAQRIHFKLFHKFISSLCSLPFNNLHSIQANSIIKNSYRSPYTNFKFYHYLITF